MEYNHNLVLYDEVIKGLNIKRTEYILTARLAEGCVYILERLDKRQTYRI